jgi:lysosomal acid lipase/cholesteryl ester hydrolase
MEKHHYVTKDGYINTVFRIPGPKGTKEGLGAQGKPVVIYQHGLFDCFAGVLNDEEDSLGIRLVNQGYDLWMGNARCNRYSRDHQWMEVDTSIFEVRSKFWEISFDDMAEFDQPALWEFILGQTKQE